MRETTNSQEKKREVIPLTHVEDGSSGIVQSIEAGFRATQRLSGLGITPGTVVQVIGKGPFKGPLRIRFRGTQLAIGRGLAHKIFISAIE